VGVPGLGLLLPVLAHDLGAPQAGVVASEQRHPPVRRRHPVRPPRRVGAGLDARELPVPWLDVYCILQRKKQSGAGALLIRLVIIPQLRHILYIFVAQQAAGILFSCSRKLQRGPGRRQCRHMRNDGGASAPPTGGGPRWMMGEQAH
jgi:hypothetical protein